ncbi:hypothetical protein CC78DRAFT_95717 [Lojkania enalia]|uniref:Uncharacterized protein n=1 Tax=Lojkania enalia TaxID=147567 RepID=A0A9P4K288_9PLEO|nr:hypothetical protein CC78DRAFT_95717 [Didymosphaeria enalia]
MCLIAFSPAKRHKRHLHHHSHHHDEPLVEELVRVSHPTHHHHSKVRIVMPAPQNGHTHHRYHHHHYHPLHLHPPSIRLHGHGKKRAPTPPPPGPRPIKSRPRSRSGEPTYRTQVVEPQEVRETTRIALREAAPNRGRLRRVAGYEVLSSRVPWSWDCVSSASSGTERRVRRVGGLKHPPFGSLTEWI